jgi:hypothetical protein
MRPGPPARRSHDYRRHRVTSLFTALDIATGRIIGKCYGRHRTKFHKFLSGSRTYHCRRSIAGPVCTENLIRVADVLKSPKLTE